MASHYDAKPLSDYSDLGSPASRVIPCTAVQASANGSVSFTFTEIVNEPKNRNRFFYDQAPNQSGRQLRQWDAIRDWNDDPPTFLIEMNMDYAGLHAADDDDDGVWVAIDGYGGPLLPGDQVSGKVDGLPQGVFVRVLLLRNPNYGYESGRCANGMRSQYLAACSTGSNLQILPTDIVREVRLTTSTDS